jgi:hypothetical protein
MQQLKFPKKKTMTQSGGAMTFCRRQQGETCPCGSHTPRNPPNVKSSFTKIRPIPLRRKKRTIMRIGSAPKRLKNNHRNRSSNVKHNIESILNLLANISFIAMPAIVYTDSLEEDSCEEDWLAEAAESLPLRLQDPLGKSYLLQT